MLGLPLAQLQRRGDMASSNQHTWDTMDSHTCCKAPALAGIIIEVSSRVCLLLLCPVLMLLLCWLCLILLLQPRVQAQHVLHPGPCLGRC